MILPPALTVAGNSACRHGGKRSTAARARLRALQRWRKEIVNMAGYAHAADLVLTRAGAISTVFNSVAYREEGRNQPDITTRSRTGGSRMPLTCRYRLPVGGRAWRMETRGGRRCKLAHLPFLINAMRCAFTARSARAPPRLYLDGVRLPLPGRRRAVSANIPMRHINAYRHCFIVLHLWLLSPRKRSANTGHLPLTGCDATSLLALYLRANNSGNGIVARR